MTREITQGNFQHEETQKAADRYDIFILLVSAPPLLDALSCHLDTIDVIRLSWTCRIAREAIQKFNKRAFNFDLHFRRFFEDPTSFRRLMERTNTIVTGANALQFFTRETWPDSELELYVEWIEVKEVCEWLTTEERYDFVPQNVYDGDGENMVRTLTEALQVESDDDEVDFHHRKHVLKFVGPDESRKIHVVACGGYPGRRIAPLYVLLTNHSTCMMNIITHAAAYCLYPALTIRDYTSLMVQWDENTLGVSGAEVYRERCWKALEPGDSTNEDYLSDIRSIGDRHCWIIRHSPLDDLTPHDLMTLNEWRISVRSRSKRVLFVDTKSISKRYGRYSYACCPFGTRGGFEILDVAEEIKNSQESGRKRHCVDFDWSVYHRWRELMDPKRLFAPKPRRIHPDLAHVTFWWENKGGKGND